MINEQINKEVNKIGLFPFCKSAQKQLHDWTYDHNEIIFNEIIKLVDRAKFELNSKTKIKKRSKLEDKLKWTGKKEELLNERLVKKE